MAKKNRKGNREPRKPKQPEAPPPILTDFPGKRLSGGRK